MVSAQSSASISFENAEVSRETLHQRVTQEIARIILKSASDQSGKRMLPSEPELCQQFGVSRTVLREAVKVLAAKGLVELRPRVGMRVLPRSEWRMLDADLLAWQCELSPDHELIRNIFETRLLVEPAAARLAAKRASREEIETLGHWYREMEAQVEKEGTGIDPDMKFHAMIALACHNEIIQQMVETGSRALRVLVEIADAPRGNATKALTHRRKALAYHREVYDAIRNRASAEAQVAMERLVEAAARDLHQTLQIEGNWTD
jgi:GntR family galactonate operon transcriptional repressor